jgi:hypothetical protein
MGRHTIAVAIIDLDSSCILDIGVCCIFGSVAVSLWKATIARRIETYNTKFSGSV